MPKYQTYPNSEWNIEVTKSQIILGGLDSIIEQLKKHIKLPGRICIIKFKGKYGGYSVFRKADRGEESLIDRNRKKPRVGMIVKVY